MNDDKWVLEYPLHEGTDTWMPSTTMGYRTWGKEDTKIDWLPLEELIQKARIDNTATAGYRIRNVVTNEVILWSTLSVIVTP